MSNANQFYNIKNVAKYLGWFLALGIAMKFTQGAAFVVLLPIAFLALSKRDATGVFFAIMFSVMSVIANEWLMPKGLIYAICQRGLMAVLGFVMLFQVCGQRNSSFVRPLLPILLYIIYMIPSSMMGWSPIISGLKLFLFVIVFMALYASANGVITRNVDVRKIRELLLAMACFFVFGSLIVLPFPGISYMGADALLKNPDMVSLFKGMTNQSQALGPILAMIGVLVFSDLVFTIQKPDKLYVSLMLVMPFLLYKTSSRTAMGVFIMGIFVMSYQLLRARGVKIPWRNKILSTLISFVIIAMLSILLIPRTREGIVKFVVKYGGRGSELTSENILMSREKKLEGALENWRRSPWLGNGFQVSEQMEGFKATSISSILSAPVEKSTWTHAILEEGGIFGEIIFVLFILTTVPIMFKRQAYIGGTLFVSFIILNLGEFMIFSMSGGGGFFWELVFLGCVIDAKRVQARKQQVPMFYGFMGVPQRHVGYNSSWR